MQRTLESGDGWALSDADNAEIERDIAAANPTATADQLNEKQKEHIGRLLTEEGRVHGSLISSGLAKLDTYSGTVYRSQSFRRAEFDKILADDEYTFNYAVSTSTEQKVVLGWSGGAP